MARIALTEGYTLIPEGTYVFQIVAVNYKEEFGKMEITLQTQSGQKHIERFSLLRSDGSPNEGALNALSYFAKTALDDFSLTEIDHTDLVGRFVECDVEHEVQENKNKPGKTVTFARLTDKRPASGWEDTPGSAAHTAAQAARKAPGKKAVDLAALLG